MIHPPDCNCAACFVPVDQIATKRLSRLVKRHVDALTEKERALLERRFADPGKEPTPPDDKDQP